MNSSNKFARNLNIKNSTSKNKMTKPNSKEMLNCENEFIKKISEHALKLYERKCDIQNFTKLAMSNPENTSHNNLVKELLQKNILDPLSDEVIKRLASNEDLLNDLDL